MISVERHLEKPRIGHQQNDHDAVEHRKIAHHTQHRLLLRTDDMGGTDELGGAAELGARAGRRDLGHRLAAPDQRSGIGLHTGTGFDGYGFAGKHGLVEQDFALGEVHVRGDHAHRATASRRRPAPARPRAKSSMRHRGGRMR